MNDWRQQAACKDVDPNVFFPERGEDVGVAKRFCESCPVKEPCLEVAMQSNFYVGIWGGTSKRERRRMRSARRKAAPSSSPQGGTDGVAA